MNKLELEIFLSEVMSNDNYSWSMYGLYHNRGKHDNKTYKTIMIKFDDDNMLSAYKNTLIDYFVTYILPKKEEVSPYNGYNPKISLDSIDITDYKIADNFNKLGSSIISLDEDLKLENCNAYILKGRNEQNNITFIKKAKPVMNTKKRTRAFIRETDTLKEVNKNIYRFYYNFDCVIIDNIMYCLNDEFESLFGIDKTITLIRNKHIDDIKNSGIINKDDLEKYSYYVSTPTLIRKLFNYDKDELEKMNDILYRKSVAEKLGISLNTNNMFLLKNEKEYRLLIQHLCGNVTRNLMAEELCYVTNKRPVTD